MPLNTIEVQNHNILPHLIINLNYNRKQFSPTCMILHLFTVFFFFPVLLVWLLFFFRCCCCRYGYRVPQKKITPSVPRLENNGVVLLQFSSLKSCFVLRKPYVVVVFLLNSMRLTRKLRVLDQCFVEAIRILALHAWVLIT
jgi:hypothetical protein